MDIQYSVELEVAKEKSCLAIAELRKARDSINQDSQLYTVFQNKVTELMLSSRKLRELDLSELTEYSSNIVTTVEKYIIDNTKTCNKIDI